MNFAKGVVTFEGHEFYAVYFTEATLVDTHGGDDAKNIGCKVVFGAEEGVGCAGDGFACERSVEGEGSCGSGVGRNAEDVRVVADAQEVACYGRSRSGGESGGGRVVGGRDGAGSDFRGEVEHARRVLACPPPVFVDFGVYFAATKDKGLIGAIEVLEGNSIEVGSAVRGFAGPKKDVGDEVGRELVIGHGGLQRDEEILPASRAELGAEGSGACRGRGRGIGTNDRGDG